MKQLRQFLRNAENKFFWRKTTIKPKQLKHLDKNVKQFFRYRIMGNTVYVQLRKESFIYLPKNSKRIKNLQQVQVEVKPISFSV
jgi:hypothetical protein